MPLENEKEGLGVRKEEQFLLPILWTLNCLQWAFIIAKKKKIDFKKVTGILQHTDLSL